MDHPAQNFTGIWLHEGDRQGSDFSHEQSAFDHTDEAATTAMRHAVVEREGKPVGVWVPASWSDEQAREALESNW